MANILPRSMANNAMLISKRGWKRIDCTTTATRGIHKSPTKTALRKKHLKRDLKEQQTQSQECESNTHETEPCYSHKKCDFHLIKCAKKLICLKLANTATAPIME